MSSLATAVKKPKTKEQQLDDLVLQLQELKNLEDGIKKGKLIIEEQIIKLAGVKEEGSQTTKTDQFKITTTGTIYRKVNPALLEERWSSLSDKALACFRFKPELVPAQIKAAQADKNLMMEIAEIVTETPGKPSVKFEAIEPK